MFWDGILKYFVIGNSECFSVGSWNILGWNLGPLVLRKGILGRSRLESWMHFVIILKSVELPWTRI